MRRFVLVILAWCSLAAPSQLHAQAAGNGSDWPQFRGVNVDGIAAGGGVFAGTEPINLLPAWKVSIGSGYSGLAIAHGLVATMFEAGEVNVLAVFDTETGAERWRFEVGKRHPGIDGSYNGPISTPLITGNFIIGLGPWGRLFALDQLDGELVWSTSLVEDMGSQQPNYGFATSPISYQGKVIVQAGAASGSISAFQPETGELLWSLGSDDVAYQSPVPLKLGGRSQLVVAGNKQLMAIDGGKAELLWEYAHGGRGMIGAQTIVPVAAGGEKIFLLHQSDGSAVVELRRTEGDLSVAQLWEARSIRNSYTVPVYHDGHIYGFSSRFLTCVDPDTGEAVWRSRPPGDGFPIIVDGHLAILTKDGSLHVAPASPEGYREIAMVKLFEELAWSPPTFAHGSFFVRSLNEIARVDIGRGIEVTDALDTMDTISSASGPGAFARLLTDVREASDKETLVDRFLAARESFPIVEGERRVHFIYRGSGTDLAIAGDLIGSRQEVRMARLEGTDLFYYSTELEPDARVNYRFIRDYEEIRDPRNPRETTTAIYRADMELNRGEAETAMSWMAMPRWVSPAHLEEPPAGHARGELVTHEIQSDVYGAPHQIHVYLPAEYAKGDHRYPVAYYHGGLGALRRGKVPNSLDNLLGRNVTPLIAVFIERTGEWIPDAYSDMWAGEIVPFIDTHYRTVPEQQGRASIGGGDHGFVAAYAAFKKPGVAGKLGVHSIGGLSFQDKKDGLEGLIRTPSEQPLVVYMDWGLYDMQNPQEAWDRRSQAQEYSAFVAARGYEVIGGQVHDGAGWSSWKNRTHELLRTLFPHD